MSEVGFFPKYEQKENKVTNYTLLLLRQIYNESPSLFEEFIVNLLADESQNIKIGVSFSQQEGFSCEKGKSIIDGVIKQMPFQVFIETKTSDWYYEDQLERHIENLSKFDGQKIFIALANFDGLTEANLFEKIKNKYKDTKDLIIKNIEFEELKNALDVIKENTKSTFLSNLVVEYEQFLDLNSLLPTQKYRLDVVNCSSSKDDVIARNLYICPEAKGAYKHARSKYFGIYENKRVNYIAEIKAVCDYEPNSENVVNISWYDKDFYNDEKEVLKYAKEKVDNHENIQSVVNPEKMMSAMNDYAAMSRNMFVLNQRLNSACSRLNARTARYTTRPIQLQQAAQFK